MVWLVDARCFFIWSVGFSGFPIDSFPWSNIVSLHSFLIFSLGGHFCLCREGMWSILSMLKFWMFPLFVFFFLFWNLDKVVFFTCNAMHCWLLKMFAFAIKRSRLPMVGQWAMDNRHKKEKGACWMIPVVWLFFMGYINLAKMLSACLFNWHWISRIFNHPLLLRG